MVLKAFQLVQKSANNNFHECATQTIPTVSNTVTCTVILQLSANYGHTIDPNQASASLLYIAACE